jgi:hypothetical protein
MIVDSTLTAGLAGAGVMLFLGAAPFFVGWGSLHAMIDALKARMAAAESELATIGRLQADVAYVRGQIDGLLRELQGRRTAP